MPVAKGRINLAPVTSPAAPAPRSSTEPNAAPKKRGRVVFIDALRLLALMQMVNGHTLDAVMVDSIRTSEWFPTYDYLRGLVSVSFMFAAGLAYHLTTFVRFDPVRAAAGRRKRVTRAFFLIAIGYAMRLGPNLLSSDAALRDVAVAYLCRIDVLHCIGFSILVLETITACVRTADQARIAAASAATILLVLAPVTGAIPIDAGNRVWLGWLSHEGASYFPVAPWAAYPLLGAALGGVVAPDEGGAKKAPRRLLFAAVGAYLLAIVLRVQLPHLGEGIHPASSPAFFLEKLAALLVLCAPLAFLVRNVPALPRPLEVLTGETLVVYVFHLLALFAPFVGPARMFRHALELPQACFVASVMIVVSFGVGLAAPEIRRRVSALLARPTARPAEHGAEAAG